MPEELGKLCADVQYWIKNNTYETDEIASRFHHRLVFIHPFPNGNGRHGRLMADLLLEWLKRPAFTWGSADLNRLGSAREYYLAALRAGDKDDYGPLLQFVRA
ncbi:MAG: mobile mystery protein B [Bacillota bacterium]